MKGDGENTNSGPLMTCKVSIQPLIVKQPIWVLPGGSGSEIPEKSTASRTAKNLGVGGSWGKKKKMKPDMRPSTQGREA